jgi:Fe-Mn family superoxide dismutase
MEQLMKHQLSPLPYPYDALEPYIDARTMELHHSKHHQTYADKFNAALGKHPELFDKTPEELLSDLSSISDDIKGTVQNNGGGYVNHNLFWSIMKPGGGGVPVGILADEINKTFGSFEEFKKRFRETALGHFGSGWVWLVWDPSQNRVEVFSLPNQDSPLSSNKMPLLTLDVWEHAYYLKYQNRRAEYIEAWWNVAGWDAVGERFAEAHSGR